MPILIITKILRTLARTTYDHLWKFSQIRAAIYELSCWHL